MWVEEAVRLVRKCGEPAPAEAIRATLGNTNRK
jgi:hypothetical protein